MSKQLRDFAGLSIVDLTKNYGTPFFAYDSATILTRIQEVKAFDVVRYAQKACSNLGILGFMRKHGVVVDAVSAGEVYKAIEAGFSPSSESGGVANIVYTADLFDKEAREVIAQHSLPVNVGSPDMIDQLAQFSPKSKLTLRINPGFGHGHSQKTNTGGPLSKHGIWHEQLGDCLEKAKRGSLTVEGIHMHIGSGSDFEHLSKVCEAMVKTAIKVGPQLRLISAGGGLPIPYKKDQARIDVKAYYNLWNQARKHIEESIGHAVSLEVEPGRYLIAESSILVAQIWTVKKMGDNLFYILDAGFNDLVRPAFYGSYHEISIASRDGRDLSPEAFVVVGGPLCESGDVFTQEEGGLVVKRRLPLAEVGDFLVIHDTGAYGSAMSSNYNSRTLAPELLLREGKVDVIRERQSYSSIWQHERMPKDLA